MKTKSDMVEANVKAAQERWGQLSCQLNSYLPAEQKVVA
jgi:hypothetical protein